MTEIINKGVPLKGIQRITARKMHESLINSAQLTFHSQCNVKSLSNRYKLIKNEGGSSSIQDILIYYLSISLSDHPMLNATFENDNVFLHKYLNLNFALSLDNGFLIAPVILEVNKMTLEEISRCRRELTERARNEQLSINEMKSGTFTITNLGLSKVKYFTPILNAPQVAILGVGCTENRLIMSEEGDLENVPFMNLSLTFDHRVINGEPAANFLSSLVALIEEAPNIS